MMKMELWCVWKIDLNAIGSSKCNSDSTLEVFVLSRVERLNYVCFAVQLPLKKSIMFIIASPL
jgi:hypothetical protein